LKPRLVSSSFARNRPQLQSPTIRDRCPTSIFPKCLVQVLPAEVLIAKIKSSACAFDTAPTSLKNLKAVGVPDKVILAMIEAPVGQPRTAAAVAAPVTSDVSNSASQPSSTPSVPSDGKTRVLVTDSQSWETRGELCRRWKSQRMGCFQFVLWWRSPANSGIIKTLNQRCPQITVTSRLDKADS